MWPPSFAPQLPGEKRVASGKNNLKLPRRPTFSLFAARETIILKREGEKKAKEK
jgi:hypothetical protein